MPLKSAQVWQILAAKQTEFTAFDQSSLELLRAYRRALKKISQLTQTELAARLVGLNPTGACPLEPLGHSPGWVISSSLAWQNRQESLDWVRDCLTGITTFAVDGSQIYPSKELSIPIALVQVGWFENPHLPSGTYTKDVELDVMTPAELEDKVNGCPADRLVNMRRFQREIERLIAYMQAQTQPSTCLVFFDGALVGTFAETFETPTQDFYVQCLLDLLRASEKYRVPLVGYLDTSNAGDLVTLLHQVEELPPAPRLRDARLLGEAMAWGDRTPLFLSDRPILSQYQEQSERVAFTYLKTHGGNPVRLELPRWLYEEGLHEQVIDWVRAEVIVGGGYPYSIETADQTAVLQNGDRQLFYQILQEWAQQAELKLRFSSKMASKIRRR
jgi:NurA domain